MLTVEEPGRDRRQFLVAWIYGLWGLIGAALGVPAAGYLLFPPRARDQEEWVDAGEIAPLELRTPEEIVFRRNRRDGWKMISEKAAAWVVKLSETEVIALAPQCTHLGCAYHWEEQKQHFLCPCHTSAFDLDGKVLSGPAPRPLDRYNVRIEKGRLRLGAVEERPAGRPDSASGGSAAGRSAEDTVTASFPRESKG